MTIFSAVLFFLGLFGRTATAQPSLITLEPDTGNFPTMSAEFYMVGSDLKLRRDIAPGDVVLDENGTPRQVLDVTCPDDGGSIPLSAVLTIDVSGSMAGQFMPIAQSAARIWVEMIDLSVSECAVTSFDLDNYLNQDLTTDRQKLLAAVAGLAPKGGTDYNEGFIGYPAGGLRVAARGKHKRVMVFLTDGTSDSDYESIVKLATEENITVYTIVLGLKAPQVLKDIAEQTGGAWYEGVITEKKARDIYATILLKAEGKLPCTVTWKSEPGCDREREVAMAVPKYSSADTTHYTLPASAVPGLSIDPSLNGIDLGKVAPGETGEVTITLTANAQSVTVSSITSVNGIFEILNGAPPAFTLAAGESRTITVRFTPEDSVFAADKLEIVNDGCSDPILFVYGGFPGKPLIGEEQLEIVEPNGGEEFYVGSDTVIRWTNVSPDMEMILDYSTDAGTSWIPIASDASGLEHAWDVPNTPSNQCLMRIRSKDRIDTLKRRYDDAAAIAFAGFLPDNFQFISLNKSVTRDVRRRDITKDNILKRFGAGGGGEPTADMLPGSTRLAVGSLSNGTIKIFDAFTGNVETQLNNVGTVRFLRFSPDGMLLLGGERLVSNSPASYALGIWDIASGSRIVELSGFNGPITTGAWYPDGGRVAAGSAEGLKVFAIDGTLLQTIPVATGATAIAVSSDGKFLAAGSADGKVRIWDADTYALLHTFNDHTESVNDLVFSPDNSALASGSSDGKAVFRDPNTGDLIHIFDAGQSDLTAVDFSTGGHLLLTASEDGSIVIWDIGPAQQDISDSLWSIVTYNASTGDEIDMGKVLVGSSKDSVITAWLCNSGNAPWPVDEIVFEGADAEAFEIASQQPPLVVPPDTCIAVEFRFSPDRAGEHNAVILVISGHEDNNNADTLRSAIRGVGIILAVEQPVMLIDFGKIYVGAEKDTTVQVLINKGAEPLILGPAGLEGPDLTQFLIDAGGNGATLASEEIHTMTFRFAPTEIGVTNSYVSLNPEDFPAPLSIGLVGEGVCGGDMPATITLPEISAPSGELFYMPIIVSPAAVLSAQGVDSISFTLRFNKTLLLPTDERLTLVEEDDDYVVSLTVPLGTSDTATTLEMFATFGNAASTELIVEGLEVVGCGFPTEGVDGRFTLSNLCTEGGVTRLFKHDGTAGLKVTPNPATDNPMIEFEVIEQGRTHIDLVNNLGEHVQGVVAEDLSPGRYEITLETERIPNGLYLVVLRTPTQRFTHVVRIIR